MSRLTDTKDVVVCWSGNCGDCIKCERDAEKARADTAERHANELELSNSRQAAEILRLKERNKRLVEALKQCNATTYLACELRREALAAETP